MYKLALFASGTGSNVKNIISYFENNSLIEIDCVVSNREDAGALNHARNANITALVFNKESLNNGEVASELMSRGVTHIILAGFLLKIPTSLIASFPEKIINVHPSLLPKYGGKGMYGMHVHQAVVANGESKSGITIHLVNEIYDDGRILAQFEVPLDMYDNPEKVAIKVQALEQEHFPTIIENFLIK